MFLLLEEGDPVGEQAVVLLGSFAGDLCGDELAVQRLVVVVLVDVEVHLLHGLLNLFARWDLLEGTPLPARRASVVLLIHTRHAITYHS